MSPAVYVIGSSCIDNVDRSCIDSCPVDCIYVGARKAYIQPDECIGCGACIEACPVDAVFEEESVPATETIHIEDARNFFFARLPGRDEPLGSPGGAEELGDLGIDTELVTAT